MAPLNPPRPALVVLLMSMVNSRQPLPLRLAVLYCTSSWLHKNETAQSQLVQTLLPSEQPTGGVTAGQLLCGALFSADPLTSWLASTALSHAILNARPQQEALVRVQLSAGPDQAPVSLSTQLTSFLSHTSEGHTRLGILQFLSIWCADCGQAVAIFLQEGKLVPTLQLLLDGSPSDTLSVLIKGIAAFLLGLLALEDGSDEVVTAVRKRPGPDGFLEALAGVGKSPSYATATGDACPNAVDADDARIFHAFTNIYRQHEAAICRHVAQFEDVRAEIAEKRQNIEKIRLLTSQIEDYDKIRTELIELRVQLETVKAENVNLTDQLNNQPAVVPIPAGLSEDEIRIQLEEQLRPSVLEKLELELTPGVRESAEKQLRSELTNQLESEIRVDLEQNVLVALEEELRQKIEEELKQNAPPAPTPSPPAPSPPQQTDPAVNDELINQINALQIQIKTLTDENTNLTSNVNGLIEELKSHKMSLGQAQTDLDEQQSANSQLKEELSQTQQQTQLGQTQQQQTLLDESAKILELNQQLSTAETTIEQHKTETTGIDTKKKVIYL